MDDGFDDEVASSTSHDDVSFQSAEELVLEVQKQRDESDSFLMNKAAAPSVSVTKKNGDGDASTARQQQTVQPPHTTELQRQLEPFELLEEKHLLRVSLPSEQQQQASADCSSSDDIFTEDDRDQKQRSREPHEHLNEKYGLNVSSQVSNGASELTALTDTTIGTTVSTSGIDQSRNSAYTRYSSTSTPGAHHVQGIGADDNDPAEEGARLSSDVHPSINGDERSRNEDEIMLEANLVNDELEGGVVLPAKRDPWWRRNQVWIGVAVFLLVVTIVLSVSLTTIDASPPDAPTMSPTTELIGLEDDTLAIIAQRFPASVAAIEQEGSAQARAFQWVLGQSMVDGDSEERSMSNVTINQRYALAAFYLSTGGNSSWIESGSWMDSANECSWHGIVCENGVVVEVVLRDNGLIGTIPGEISMLADDMRNVVLGDNSLAGTIPSEIGEFASLSTLALNNNFLRGSIPESINGLTSVESVDLSSNELASSIPDNLSGLVKLRTFSVSRNQLVDVIPTSIGLVTRLEEFDFSENKISFELPSELGQLTSLQVLNGKRNSITSSLPTTIGLLTNLAILDMAENRLSGTIPDDASKMRNLTTLDLSDNLLEGALPESIGLLTHLESLLVGNNRFSGVFPETLHLVTSLRHLNVSDSIWSKISAEISRSLPNLRTLAAARCGIEWEASNTAIFEASDLEVLDLSGNIWKIEDNDNVLLFSSFPKLRVLKFSDFKRFSPLAMRLPSEIGLLSGLEVLDLSNSGRSFGGMIPTELALLGNLTDVNLGGTELSGSLPSTLSKLTNLETMQLPSNFLTGPLPSIEGMTNLRVLNVEGNVGINGKFPGNIVQLSQLEELSFGDTAMTGSLPGQWGTLSRLRVVDLNGMSSITGPIPDLTGLTELEEIDFGRTLLTGDVSDVLSSFPNLKKVALMQSPGLFGTLLSGIGQMQKLTSMDLGQLNLTTSTLPTEVSKLSSLEQLNLQATGIQGTIPTELLECTKLRELSFAENPQIDISIATAINRLINLRVLDLSGTSLNGTIPAALGDLILLEKLDLSETTIVSPFPSAFANLGVLKDLKMSGTKNVVSFPPEIGSLSSLTSLDMSDSGIRSTTFPSEISGLSNLDLLYLRNTDISGTIPARMFKCVVVSETEEGPYTRALQLQFFQKYRAVFVDCDKVACLISCCVCTTMTPSTAPSTQPSRTSSPSTTSFPSQAPSDSLSPSSLADASCGEFVSLSDIGTLLPFSPNADDQRVTMDLPFDINWFGTLVSSVGISVNGNIHMGTGIDEISVASADLLFTDASHVYTAQVEDYFVVSWEEVIYYATVLDPSLPMAPISFQTALHPDGRIELRWGPGSLADTSFTFSSGLYSLVNDVQIWVTEVPFDLFGQSEPSSWPSMTCHLLVADVSFLPPPPSQSKSPTTVPSASLMPTLTDRPTWDPVKMACSDFVYISDIGTRLPFPDPADEGSFTIVLPTPLQWFGKLVSAVNVNINGAVVIKPLDYDPYGPSVDPIEEITNPVCPEAARIAIAHGDLVQGVGGIYHAQIGDSYVVSWENVTIYYSFPPPTEEQALLNFQTVLHSDGRIELRWGPGNIDNLGWSFASGLEDMAINAGIPVTGEPFDQSGVSSLWPAMTCKLLIASLDA